MQDASAVAGSVRVDIGCEFIEQNQLRDGTKNISAAQDADEEALE